MTELLILAIVVSGAVGLSLIVAVLHRWAAPHIELVALKGIDADSRATPTDNSIDYQEWRIVVHSHEDRETLESATLNVAAEVTRITLYQGPGDEVKMHQTTAGYAISLPKGLRGATSLQILLRTPRKTDHLRLELAPDRPSRPFRPAAAGVVNGSARLHLEINRPFNGLTVALFVVGIQAIALPVYAVCLDWFISAPASVPSVYGWAQAQASLPHIYLAPVIASVALSLLASRFTRPLPVSIASGYLERGQSLPAPPLTPAPPAPQKPPGATPGTSGGPPSGEPFPADPTRG